ncbi:MAG: CBS domain-containing protein [Candidatus Omnitrophica bacterium]|nr:CBS domain-containing protein [Candidatus Omnitrophota bacterium]
MKRLLLIDDDEGVLNALERALRDDGHVILKCTSAEEALPIVAGQDIDLVICDYKLTGMDGISFLEKIAKDKADIVSILLTGYADVQVASEAVNRLSLQGFITKPWDTIALKATVKSALERDKKLSVNTIRAADIMSKFAITIPEDASINEAADLIMRFKISGIPVLSRNGVLAGIITATDLFRIMGEEVDNPARPAYASTVNSIMTKNVQTITAASTLSEIIRLMCGDNIHTLPVVDGDNIVGVVGRRDVLYRYYRLRGRRDG